MTWLKDTIGTLVVLRMMWYSAVVKKKPVLLILIFTDLLPLLELMTWKFIKIQVHNNSDII